MRRCAALLLVGTAALQMLGSLSEAPRHAHRQQTLDNEADK
jgi:hypothetical protein